jgi:hypothetical protein
MFGKNKNYSYMAHIVILLCSILLIVPNPKILGKPKSNNSKVSKVAEGKKKKTKATGLEVEKDFDTIRSFYSYDPSTDTWSKIEEFSSVEILEDTTIERPENYIYKEFWSYDKINRKWQKADIRDYGYKINNVSDKFSWKKFFKNLSLGVSSGSSLNFHKESFSGDAQLYIRDSAYLLKTSDAEYELSFFKIPDTKLISSSSSVYGYVDKIKIEDLSKIYFKGTGFSFPVNLTLSYTFWDKFRVGVTSFFDMDFLKALTSSDKQYPDLRSDSAPFYGFGFSALVGFKFFSKPKYSLLVDADWGVRFNKGSEITRFFSEKSSNVANMLSLGLVYERKVTSIGSFFARISSGTSFFTKSIDTSFNRREFTIPVALQLGFSIKFGNDK